MRNKINKNMLSSNHKNHGDTYHRLVYESQPYSEVIHLKCLIG